MARRGDEEKFARLKLDCSDLDPTKTESNDENPQTLRGSTSSAGSYLSFAGPFVEDGSSTNDFFSFELANEMILRSNFRDAITVLENLPSSARRQLMMSECFLQLGQMLNAGRCIDSFSGVMRSQQMDSNVVMRLIDECIFNRRFTKALILLSCASKMFKVNQNVETAIEGIRMCASKLSTDVFPNLAAVRENPHVSRIGLEMVNDMLTDMQSVPCTDRDVKDENEARCINYIGWCHIWLREYSEANNFFRRGAALMEQKFGTDAVKYQIYGDLLNNIGESHWSLNNLDDAKRYFEKAREVYEAVENWQTFAIEQKHKRKVKTNLETVENLLRNL